MRKTSVLSKTMIHLSFIILCLLCVLPMLIVLSASVTDEMELVKNGYSVFPKHFSIDAYKMVILSGTGLIDAYMVTIFVTVIGTFLSLMMTTLTSYTLSRTDFKYRGILSFFIYFTVLFSGGMIPSYILVTKYLKMGDTIFALIIPALIMPWFIFLMRRFLSDIPLSLIESAKIDGASEYTTFFRIVLPISKPAVATISLLMVLAYWNNWMLSLLYIESKRLYTLQYLLYIIMQNVVALQEAAKADFGAAQSLVMPQKSLRMAMVFLSAGPILFIFPFFQKYFVRGLTVGAVKG